jgi:hypothetical protein
MKMSKFQKMAEEAYDRGVHSFMKGSGAIPDAIVASMAKALRTAVEEEREACAKVAERLNIEWKPDPQTMLASAIRSRKEKDEA